MFLAVVACILVVLSFAFPKNKSIFILFGLFCTILFSFSSGNADYNVHLNRFNMYQDYSWYSEPLYTLFMILFNKMNLTYECFLFFVGILFVTIHFCIIKKETKYICLAAALFFVFPFSMNVTTVRFSFGACFMLLGIYIFLNKKRYYLFKFCIYCMLASLIHYSFLFFFVLILFERRNRQIRLKQTIIISCVLFIIELFCISNLPIIIPFLPISLQNKLSVVLEFGELFYSDKANYTYPLKIIIVFIVESSMYFYMKKYIDKSKIKNTKTEYIDKVFQIDVITLLILPMTIVSKDIFRIQMFILFFNYLAFCKFLDLRENFSYKNNKNIFKIASFVLPICYLILFVLRGEALETTIFPLFNDNSIFSLRYISSYFINQVDKSFYIIYNY